MVNDLIADDRLCHRYTFWVFRYASGNPIAYAAASARDDGACTLSSSARRE
jgi:hypothetical protein